MMGIMASSSPTFWGHCLEQDSRAAAAFKVFFDSIMFDDDWPRVHLGIVVSYLRELRPLPQFIWIIGAKMASSSSQPAQASLFVCPLQAKKKELATTWLDHYFQVRGNIAVNSEVSSWLGGVCTVLRALCTASYVGVTLRRILVSYASGRKLKSSGHHFISKTSSRSQPSITTSQYQQANGNYSHST